MKITEKDKIVNRFIVMCIEQYAEYVNQPSSVVYQEMKKEGVINWLRDDYEDMHGMSTLYINDFIYSCLHDGKQKDEQ